MNIAGGDLRADRERRAGRDERVPVTTRRLSTAVYACDRKPNSSGRVDPGGAQFRQSAAESRRHNLTRS